MKRSELNRVLTDAVAFFSDHQFFLPPWAFRTPDEWRRAGTECAEIRDRHLGWDITDFGSGDFARRGLTLFTIRNGDLQNPQGKNYCEKIMIVRENQVTPCHYHKFKTEDIINRGGGTLVMALWYADAAGRQSDRAVTVQCDGITRTFPAGEPIRLKTGESITLEPQMYHCFHGENGTVLVGEVSKTNDDSTDNFFLEPVGRFPAIEEDVPPRYLLCNEYPASR